MTPEEIVEAVLPVFMPEAGEHFVTTGHETLPDGLCTTCRLRVALSYTPGHVVIYDFNGLWGSDLDAWGRMVNREIARRKLAFGHAADHLSPV